MMGILGHDLRNPLHAITMASDVLLRREDRPETERRQLARIGRAAERMQEMIETLLDFTRLRYLGAFPVTPTAADLGEIARAVVDELCIARPDCRIELHLEGDPRRVGSARMSQAISNLVANAISYGAPDTSVDVFARGSAVTSS